MTTQPPWGSATSGVKRLMRREIKSRSETITGTVLSLPRIVDLDGQGSATWVVDVDIGDSQVLRDVSVKAGSGGQRFYAGLNQTVKLGRNTQGRFDVIGPGDRVGAVAVVKKYQLGISAPISTENRGLAAERVPYSYYAGPNPPIDPSRWNDGITPYPYIRIVDGDGNPVT